MVFYRNGVKVSDVHTHANDGQGGQLDQSAMNLTAAAVATGKAVRQDEFSQEHSNAGAHVLSTRVETLVYTSGTPGAGEFTHALTQEASIGNAVIEDITVVKTNIGGGQAHVKLFVEISYLQEDATFNVTFAPGTLTSSFLPRVRAFRPTLNVVAYVLITWVSADIVSVNRDNNIDGDSPVYFIIDGIGTY